MADIFKISVVVSVSADTLKKKPLFSNHLLNGRKRKRKDELISYTKGERQIEMDERKREDKRDRERFLAAVRKKKREKREIAVYLDWSSFAA